MRSRTYRVHVEFMDDQTRVIQPVGGTGDRGGVQDGVLHLYFQNGQYADREHVASLPLCNIRSYKFVPKQP